MSELIWQIIQLNQRSSMNELLASLDDEIQVMEQILHPVSGKITLELKARFDGRDNCDAMRSCETRSLEELDDFFSEFGSTVRDCSDLLCILPGVSFCDESVITKYPVLRTSATVVKRLYAKFSRTSAFDFFGVILSDMNRFMVVSSYADFPSAANQYFDGTIYEAAFVPS